QEPAPQDFQRFGLVLELRSLILTFDDKAGRNMTNLNSTIGGIDPLATGAPARCNRDIEVLFVDVDIDVVSLGQHGDRRCGGVNAALSLGRGDALHAMHAALKA